MSSVLDKQLSALDAARPGLETLAHGWEIALWTATGICALGVIVEIGAVIAEVCENRRRKKPIPKYEIAALGGAILVALAVVGEGLFEFEGASLETRLRGNSESVEAVLNEKAIGAGSEAFKAINEAGGLERYVQQKTSEIDKTISDLNAAQKRAKESLAKIDPLEKRQEALSREISTDEGRLGTIEGDEKGLLDAILPRPHEMLMGNDFKSTLRQYADLPVFVSAATDPDSQGVQRRIASIIRYDTGKEATILPPSTSDLMPGIRVTAADPEPVQKFGGTVTQEDFALWNSVARSHKAAQEICSELIKQYMPDVRTDADEVDSKSRTSNPPWIATVPLQGIIINIGPKRQAYLQSKMNERTGEGWVNRQEKEFAERDRQMERVFGPRPGPCS